MITRSDLGFLRVEHPVQFYELLHREGVKVDRHVLDENLPDAEGVLFVANAVKLPADFEELGGVRVVEA